jgi:hypothetical protein
LKDEIDSWLEDHVENLQAALGEICEQEHAYHYNPPGYHVDETAIELEAFQKLSEKFALIVIQMTGTFDTWSESIMEMITDLKEHEKERIDLRRRAAEHSLTIASDSFGEGIEFVRGSVEMKAMLDQEKIQETCTDAREIVTYQLAEKKDNLWRQISYLTKKLYADERPDYNHKIKTQILEKFKEFKDVIVDATKQINSSQHEKWTEYQTAMADYYKFYDKKVIGAKQSLFDVAQGLLVKKMKQKLQQEDETTGGKFDDYEMKVFKQLHTHRETMTALYNNAIRSIDKIEDRYLTTPLVEILNGHKEEADYQFKQEFDLLSNGYTIINYLRCAKFFL